MPGLGVVVKAALNGSPSLSKPINQSLDGASISERPAARAADSGAIMAPPAASADPSCLIGSTAWPGIESAHFPGRARPAVSQ